MSGEYHPHSLISSRNCGHDAAPADTIQNVYRVLSYLESVMPDHDNLEGCDSEGHDIWAVEYGRKAILRCCIDALIDTVEIVEGLENAASKECEEKGVLTARYGQFEVVKPVE